jgi:hypothetical protein
MLPLSLLLGGGLIVTLLMVHFINASANSGDIAKAEAQYPAMVGKNIDTCALCHAASGAPALNPFGAAYKSNGRSQAALVAIQGQDSDGDGFSNLAEITALTFPGDAQSFPAAPTATATATRVPSNTPTAQASSTGQPTATKTVSGATATATSTLKASPTAKPTQVGTVTKTKATQGPRMTKTPYPTSVAPCKDDDDDDGSEMSSSSATGQFSDKDDKDCDDHGGSGGSHNDDGRGGKGSGGGRGGDHEGGSTSFNWFENIWKDLAIVFQRGG